MVAYRYATKVAFVKGAINTLAANVSVLVYALTDTGYTTPLVAYSDRELTTITNIVTDENGIPETDFYLNNIPDCRWKSGTMVGEWATTQSRPGPQGPVSTVPGPAGPKGADGTAGLNGANASIFEDTTIPGLYRFVTGNQLTEDLANPGLYTVTGA